MGRDAVNVLYQIGAESTPGTPVAGSKQLPSLSFTVSPNLRTKPHRANGLKIPAIVQLQREMTRGSYEGPVSYNEIVYPLAGIIGESGGVVTAGSVNTWEFLPNSSGADADRKTFTLEVGDASNAQQAAYCQFSTFRASFSNDDAMMSGDLFARKLVNIANLAAAPTLIPQIPANINEINIFLDSSFGALGTTKLTDPFTFDFEIGEKLIPKEVLNTDFPDFKETIEQPYEVTVKWTCEYNAQTQAIYTAMKGAGLPTRYLQCRCTGPALGAGNYLIEFNAAVKLSAVERRDQNGVYAYEFTGLAVHDTAMGRAYSIKVQNALSAL